MPKLAGMRGTGLVLGLSALLVVVVAGSGSGCHTARETESPAPVLRLTRTFPLPGATQTRTNVGVPGRIDHLAYDPLPQRLFVAALENNSMEVIDLAKGERVQSIPGILGAQGAACVDNRGVVAMTSGEDGRLHIFDTRTLEQKQVLQIGPDADNVRYDAHNNTVLVTYGGAIESGIAVLDAVTWQRVRNIRFSTRPESFQLDPYGPWLFANLPSGIQAQNDGEVAIANRDTGQIVTVLRLPRRARNFPMAYDSEHRRLFIACRRPARLLAIDVRNRSIISDVPCTDDSDDLFYDTPTSQVLVIGGGFRSDLQTPESRSPCSPPGELGGLDVFTVSAKGQLARRLTIPTAEHARTGLFVPSRRALYVAVPFRGERPPEIREYRLE